MMFLIKIKSKICVYSCVLLGENMQTLLGHVKFFHIVLNNNIHRESNRHLCASLIHYKYMYVPLRMLYNTINMVHIQSIMAILSCI